VPPVDEDDAVWDGWDDVDTDERDDIVLMGTPRRAAVDPLLLRVGAIVAAAVLATPVALALRDEPDDQLATAETESSTTTAPEASGETLSTGLTRTARRRSSTTAVAMVEKRTATDDETEAPVEVDDTPAPETTAAPAARCAAEYEVVAGDYWVRLADAAGVGLGALLGVNGASSDTALYPGDVICLPDGAQQPAPPPAPTTETPTTQATTTQATTTQAPTTEATTTEPPEQTKPPTTPEPTRPPTTPAPTRPPTTTTAPPPPSGGSPEAIVREIWPNELEERALEIARRESGLDPRAYNGWCCYGLFQIYFDVNRSFLAGLGITSSDQLLDARTNANAAYAMYQASGWSPWSTTDPGG